MTTDINQPNYLSPSYLDMQPDWERMQNVYGGVRTLRKCDYLIKFDKESASDYTARKTATEFYNVTAGTIGAVVGMVCKNNIAPTEAPPALAELFTDIDLCGNDLASFLRVTFTNAARDGHSFFLVSSPPPVDTGDAQATLKNVENQRPYWVNYRADQLINTQDEIVNGKTVLTQITVKETTREPDGKYGQKDVVKYRTINRGSYSLVREEKDKDGEITLIPEQTDVSIAAQDIQLCVVYGKQTGFLESRPPYFDLMEMNLTHYNSQSILREALKYIVPFPVFKFDSFEDVDRFKDSNKKLDVAANRALLIGGHDADAFYLELKGDSLAELRTDIENLEKRMAKMGIEKFSPIDSGADKTAFEIGSDNRKELSEVSIMAKNLENAVEQGFAFTVEAINAIKGANTVSLTDDDKTKLHLNIDWDKLTFSLDQLKFLNTLVDTGKLSLQTFLEFLPQVTEMPKGFSAEQEVERVKKEKALEPQPDTVPPVVPPQLSGH